MEKATQKREISENSLKNLRPFKKGQSGNPGGRPKNSMKSFVAKMLAEMSDEEKKDWLKKHKVSGIDIWKMAEGQPKQETEIDATVEGPSIIRLDE